MNDHASTNTARLALLLSSLLWGSSYIVMKWVLGYFHPLGMIALRMLIASGCFLLFVPFFRGNVVYRQGDWKWFLLMALGEPCLYFIFETYAMLYTTASQGGAVAAILPVFVAVGAVLTLGEKLSPRGWAGAVLAIIGVIWLSVGAQSSETAPDPLWGNFLETCAMVFAAVYSLCARRLARSYSPLFITAAQTWAGAVFFLPALFLPGMGLPDSAPPLAWAGIVYMGTVINLGAYGMYNFGLSRLKAGAAAIYLNLVPVFALLMGVLILGEQLTLLQIPAFVLVLAGLYISQRG